MTTSYAGDQSGRAGTVVVADADTAATATGDTARATKAPGVVATAGAAVRAGVSVVKAVARTATVVVVAIARSAVYLILSR